MDTKQQIEGWSKLYGRAISEEELKEICDNLYGFFNTIKQWDDEERMKQENERLNSIGSPDNSSKT